MRMTCRTDEAESPDSSQRSSLPGNTVHSRLGNAPLGRSLINAGHQDVRAECRDDRDEDEPSTRGPLVHLGDLFVLVLLGFEEVGV